MCRHRFLCNLKVFCHSFTVRIFKSDSSFSFLIFVLLCHKMTGGFFFWTMHFECNLIVSSKDFYMTCSFEFFAFIHLAELRMTAQNNNKLHLIRTRNSSFMSAYWLQSFHCVCCFKNIYTKVCLSLRAHAIIPFKIDSDLNEIEPILLRIQWNWNTVFQ